VPTRYPTAVIVVLAALATVFAFTRFPQIDLMVSRVFWNGIAFPAADDFVLDALRMGIWLAATALALAAVAGLTLSVITRAPVAGLPKKVWAFLVCLYLVGPGLIVNLMLKSHWGRARPDQVTEFGGSRTFSMAFWPSDQCAANCSFVSGEAASAMAVAVSVVVLAHWLRPQAMRLALSGAVLVALVGGGLRLAAGRHFLSDVLGAWLIVAGLAVLFDGLILRGNQGNLTPGPAAQKTPSPAP
jgi:lipid A 4'-phosphatase